jgi:hypothetical protein
MPVPVHSTGAHVPITDQHNSTVLTEGPFERAARMRREAEEQGNSFAPTAPEFHRPQQPSNPASETKLEGNAVIDVKHLDFSYPGLGECPPTHG